MGAFDKMAVFVKFMEYIYWLPLKSMTLFFLILKTILTHSHTDFFLDVLQCQVCQLLKFRDRSWMLNEGEAFWEASVNHITVVFIW